MLVWLGTAGIWETIINLIKDRRRQKYLHVDVLFVYAPERVKNKSLFAQS